MKRLEAVLNAVPIISLLFGGLAEIKSVYLAKFITALLLYIYITSLMVVSACVMLYFVNPKVFELHIPMIPRIDILVKDKSNLYVSLIFWVKGISSIMLLIIIPFVIGTYLSHLK